MSRAFWIWEWRCCGNLWELIAARRHDDPSNTIRCPTCDKVQTMKDRKWINVTSVRNLTRDVMVDVRPQTNGTSRTRGK